MGKPRAQGQQDNPVIARFQASPKWWDEVYDLHTVKAQHIQSRRDRILRFLDQLALPEKSRVLDLGCGTGRTTIELLRQGYYVDAVDIAEDMLEIARKNSHQAGVTQGVSFHEGDAENLPFGNNTFDVVVALGLIGWLTSWQTALAEMLRVTKPGGYIMMTFLNQSGLTHLVNLNGLRLWKHRILGTVPAPRNPMPYEYAPRTIHATLRKLGLEIWKSSTHGFHLRPLGREIFSDNFGEKVDHFLQSISDKRLIPYLNRLGNHHIVVARRPS